MRRLLLVPVVAVCALMLVAAPAWAHTEFVPEAAGTGKIITLELHVANERDDAGTTQVEVFFPEGVPITLVALPPVDGWTITPDGGAVGGPVTGVAWSRPASSPDEDPVLPLTIGPLPAEPTRLQFPTLQTYANGDEERWIDEWPAGAPEPDNPAPVLEVTVDGPGEAPPPIEAPATSAPEPTTTTTASATTTTVAAVPADENDDDDSDTALIVGIIIAAVVIAAAVVAWFIVRRRRQPRP